MTKIASNPVSVLTVSNSTGMPFSRRLAPVQINRAALLIDGEKSHLDQREFRIINAVI